MVSGSKIPSFSSTLTVRRGERCDLPALIALLHRYFVEGEVGHRDDPEAIESQLINARPGFLVAEFDGQLAGCMLLRELKAIPLAAEGKRMFVAPELRGHGIARRLLNAVEESARAAGFEWLYLDSKDNFATAIAMYRRYGFEDCPRFHDDAEATVFLRKRL